MTHLLDKVPFTGIVLVRDKLLKAEAEGRRTLRLESGEPSFTTPAHIQEAVYTALRQGKTHYPPIAGIPELREAICNKLWRDNRIQLDGPDSVLVTAGGMHGLYIAFRSLLEPGDEVIVPDPNWTETAEDVRLAGGVPVRCPLDPESEFAYDAEAIRGRITPRTAAILVNSPHNPTGSVFSRKELEAILAVAEERDLRIVSDEAYEHIIYDDLQHISPASLSGASNRVVSIFSFSKSYAMTGLRLGYVAVNDHTLIERGKKMLRCTTGGVPTAVQHGGVAALTGPQDCVLQMAQEYERRRDTIFLGLEKSRVLHPVKPKGTFYLWARIDPSWAGYNGKRDSWALTNLLLDKASLGSAPGAVFGASGEGCVRFSFACERDQIQEAVQAIHDLLG